MPKKLVPYRQLYYVTSEFPMRSGITVLGKHHNQRAEVAAGNVVEIPDQKIVARLRDHLIGLDLNVHGNMLATPDDLMQEIEVA